MSEKQLKYIVVEITTPSGAVGRHYVKHYDPRQGKAALLENKVTARVATQQDMVDMVTGDFEVFSPLDPVDDGQGDLVGTGKDAG